MFYGLFLFYVCTIASFIAITLQHVRLMCGVCFSLNTQYSIIIMGDITFRKYLFSTAMRAVATLLQQLVIIIQDGPKTNCFWELITLRRLKGETTENI